MSLVLAVTRGPDVGARLVVGGTGPLEGELKAQVARLGLQDRVSFPGRLADDDLVRHYQAADLTVVPTIALEGFGLVTVESLACGTPVVALDEGGPREIVTPAVGRLAHASASDLARACEEAVALAANPSTTAVCREAATAWDWRTAIVPRMEQLYGGTA